MVEVFVTSSSNHGYTLCVYAGIVRSYKCTVYPWFFPATHPAPVRTRTSTTRRTRAATRARRRSSTADRRRPRTSKATGSSSSISTDTRKRSGWKSACKSFTYSLCMQARIQDSLFPQGGGVTPLPTFQPTPLLRVYFLTLVLRVPLLEIINPGADPGFFFRFFSRRGKLGSGGSRIFDSGGARGDTLSNLPPPPPPPTTTEGRLGVEPKIQPSFP